MTGVSDGVKMHKKVAEIVKKVTNLQILPHKSVLLDTL